MAWTTPTSVAAGDPIKASLWNQDVVANTNYLKAEADAIGLVLTKAQSVAVGSSSQIVSDCFTDDFTHYRIVCKLLGTVAASTTLLMQLRTGSTTLGGTSYASYSLYQQLATGGTWAEAASPTTSSWAVGNLGNFIVGQHTEIEIANPKVAAAKVTMSRSDSFGSSIGYKRLQTGRTGDTGTYESAVFSPGSGTFSGLILVYGYKD